MTATFRNALSLVVVHWLLGVLPCTAAFTDNSDWTRCANSTYEYQFVPATLRTFNDSVLYCQNKFPGSHLAIPRNAVEDRCIFESKPLRTIWIGVRQIRGIWTDLEKNKEISYANWLPGQPDHAHCKCVTMWYHLPYSSGVQWDNWNCDTVAYFVCQRTVNVTCAARSNNSLVNGYTSHYSVLYPGNITYQCNPGYYISGQTNQSITSHTSLCLISGHWSTPEPTCASKDTSTHTYNKVAIASAILLPIIFLVLLPSLRGRKHLAHSHTNNILKVAHIDAGPNQNHRSAQNTEDVDEMLEHRKRENNVLLSQVSEESGGDLRHVITTMIPALSEHPFQAHRIGKTPSSNTSVTSGSPRLVRIRTSRAGKDLIWRNSKSLQHQNRKVFCMQDLTPREQDSKKACMPTFKALRAAKIPCSLHRGSITLKNEGMVMERTSGGTSRFQPTTPALRETNDPKVARQSGLNTPAITGIVAGSLLLFGLLSLLLVRVVWRGKQRRQSRAVVRQEQNDSSHSSSPEQVSVPRISPTDLTVHSGQYNDGAGSPWGHITVNVPPGTGSAGGKVCIEFSSSSSSCSNNKIDRDHVNTPSTAKHSPFQDTNSNPACYTLRHVRDMRNEEQEGW
ncbi:uncharacterized protein LOC135831044 [Sycon ciliatum]|uniref:uncharacterized protein LOC135831044 n=1 Tax=Sycon ciliatum TaxID=27933 RepID=UPI0031F5FB44